MGLVLQWEKGKTVRKSTLALCIAYCALCILPARAERTPEQFADYMDALTNRILRMEHPWDRDDSFRAVLDSGRMTPDELSSALVLAAESLAGATDPIDASSRRFAVSALGSFGTTNALPFLERGMRGNGPADPIEAMWSLVDLSARAPEAFGTIASALRAERREDARLHLDLYARIGDEFQYGKPDETRWKHLCGFLVERTESETVQAERLDELLCRVDPAFRESPERLRMAARLAEGERACGVTNGTFGALETSLRAKADAASPGKESAE
jgi:hypothetical protein